MFDLTREDVSFNDLIANLQNWPVRISATYTTGGLAASVFVYQTAAAPLADRDFFSCVASAPQMTELPAGSGVPGTPFYRTNTMLVNCRSATHAAELWVKVRRAVQDLADNLSLVDVLSVSDSITIEPHV